MRQGERILRLAARLGAGGSVSVRFIMQEYGASLATAKRDMVLLERALPVVKEPIPGCENPSSPKRLRLADAHVLPRTPSSASSPTAL